MTNDLKNFGYIYDVCAGFQFDLNAVLKKIPGGYSEGQLCDHNCTTQFGNYDCPAAYTKNKNAMTDTTMSLRDLKKSLNVARLGLIKMNQDFLKNEFSNYVSSCNIPKATELLMRESLNQNNVELNMFGGNPELHPNFLEIIKFAKDTGWRVTTTTTGKKFMFDTDFTNRFLQCQPNLLAISADDYESIADLKTLLNMTLDEIKVTWAKTNPLYGQRKKGLESMYAAKFFHEQTNFCPLLFNIVVHPGNLAFIEQLIKTLHSEFPNAILNPYPAQSSFSFGKVDWKKSDLHLLEKFIDKMILLQLDQSDAVRKTNVSRLPYWLALKSIYLSTREPEETQKFISGYGVWRCYSRSGAGRYLQAASAHLTNKKVFKTGGHPGCFWNNNTITDSKAHIWDLKPHDISKHILKDKVQLAKQAKKPCPGCLMPRLMFDGISIELGLNETLLPAYFSLRKKYLDF